MNELQSLQNINRDLRKSFDQLSALQYLSVNISASKKIEDIVSTLMEIIPQVISSKACRVYSYKNEAFKKEGETIYKKKHITGGINEEVIYWCCKRGDVTIHPGDADKDSQAILPLVCVSEVVGVIIIDLEENISEYSEVTGLALSSIAAHAALAISNCNSTKELLNKAEKLSQMKEYTDRVVTSIAHPVITIDPDGKITVFNSQAEHLFQIRSKIAVGNYFTAVFPEQISEFFSDLLLIVQSGKYPSATELSFKTIQEEETIVRVTPSPLKISGTSKPGMVCICQDLSLSMEVESLKKKVIQMDNYVVSTAEELSGILSSIRDAVKTVMEIGSKGGEELTGILKSILDSSHEIERKILEMKEFQN